VQHEGWGQSSSRYVPYRSSPYSTSHIDPAWCPKLDRLFYPIHSPKCDCGAAACDRGCILFALGAGVPHWRCLWVGDEPTRCHQNAAHARRWQRRHSRRCGAISAPHPYWWCGARNSVPLCLCVSVSLCLRVSVPLWVHHVSWALLRSCFFAAGVVPRSYCPVSQSESTSIQSSHARSMAV
jgi:hypothetical protein